MVKNISSFHSQLWCFLSISILTFFFLAQGKDYRTQLQLGNGALFGASYIQVLHVNRKIKREQEGFCEKLDYFLKLIGNL